jgi:L-amino acid N-acyltransferase YncA
MSKQITIRQAGIEDLEEINRTIESAISSWDLAERVKRLSLPSYLYQTHDLDTIELVVAETENGNIKGIAGWEEADPADTPNQQSALLLHGIYVKPKFQHQGIGTQLLRAADITACNGTYSGLLVKAQASATGFFKTNGMEPLAVKNKSRDYEHRFWKPCNK